MRQPIRYPIGSISSGTMRPEDLIPTFASELESLAWQTGIVGAKRRKEHRKLVREIEARMEQCVLHSPAEIHKRDAVTQTACQHCGLDIEGMKPYRVGEWRDRGNNPTCPDPPYYDSDSASYDLDALTDALEEYAAPYFYFGSCEGDGADCGFWLTSDWKQDAIGNDIPVVGDASELPAKYRGEWFQVSDHGNLRLMVTTSRATREVWGIV